MHLLYTEFKKLDDNQKTYFLVEKIQNGINVHLLQSHMKDINAGNKNRFYFAFYNISSIHVEVGSQLKNYIIMVLHYW